MFFDETVSKCLENSVFYKGHLAGLILLVKVEL